MSTRFRIGIVQTFVQPGIRPPVEFAAEEPSVRAVDFFPEREASPRVRSRSLPCRSRRGTGIRLDLLYPQWKEPPW